MNKTELMIGNSNEIAVAKNDFVQTDLIGVQYELADSVLYSFSYKVNDSIFIKLHESEQQFIQTDFVDADLPEDVDAPTKRLYAIACAGGVFAGELSILHLTEEQLNAVNEWKDRDWKRTVVEAAKLGKYPRDDFRGALEFLSRKVVPCAEKLVSDSAADAAKEYLKHLAANPSVAGLVFSILDQFSGNHFYIENEKIDKKELPSYYVIGRSVPEKFVFGFLYWLFHLSVDHSMSKRPILDELGLPRELQLSVKELVKSKLYFSISSNIQEAEKKYSSWIRKLFVEPKSEKGEEPFDLSGVIADMSRNAGLSGTVLCECIVRGFYFIDRVNAWRKSLKAESLDDLSEVEAKDILPVNNRIVSRMCLISGGTFAAVNIAGAALKNLAGKRVGNRQFAKVFLTDVNISGIGKFTVACAADSKCWSRDTKILFERLRQNNDQNQGTSSFEWEMFDALTLDALQARILWSLEAIAVSNDIKRTTDQKAAEIKQMWLDEWKQKIREGFGYPDLYFSDDEDLLYNGIYELAKDKRNWRWFYLLTMELVLFKPYIPLGSSRDKDYKRLRLDYDYIEDEFIRRQTIVSQAEVDYIKKQFSYYSGLISGNRRSKVFGAGVTSAAAVVTSGISVTCAPGIAVALAGDAVAGLHGAALTSASHDFVDGGSLAAGGLGMVGGTSIITGGGALMELVGAGTASLTAVLSKVNIEYWIRQSSKLLTFAEIVLTDRVNDWNTVGLLSDSISAVINDVTAEIAELEKEKNDLEKDNIKKVKEYKKVLERSYALLLKLYK